MNRRTFIVTAAIGAGYAQRGGVLIDVPEPVKKLKPMLDGVQPISDAERAARVEKARRLMRENKIDAVIFEPGSSLFYFTGRRGGTAAWVLPGKGEPAWIEASTN